MKDEHTLTWRKSSFCQNGECAEIAVDPETGEVFVRSTIHADVVAKFGSMAVFRSLFEPEMEPPVRRSWYRRLMHPAEL